MKENIIKKESFDFALKIINLYKFLCNEKKEFVISKQVLRSGTAIGALVAESEHAESKADFIHKISIAQKEASETSYWLELLYESKYIDKVLYNSLINDLTQIQKIIASIILSSKNNL